MLSTTSAKDCTLSTLLALHQLPEVFHLTGSRLFGTHTAGSDYDFYAAHTAELESWLADNHFFRLTPDGHDSNTVCIFRRGKVDVALLTDPDARQQIEQRVMGDKALQKLLREAVNTTQQQLLWNFLYQSLVYNNGDV